MSTPENKSVSKRLQSSIVNRYVISMVSRIEEGDVKSTSELIHNVLGLKFESGDSPLIKVMNEVVPWCLEKGLQRILEDAAKSKTLVSADQEIVQNTINSLTAKLSLPQASTARGQFSDGAGGGGSAGPGDVGAGASPPVLDKLSPPRRLPPLAGGVMPPLSLPPRKEPPVSFWRGFRVSHRVGHIGAL